MFLDSDDYWCRQDVFKTFDTYIRKDDKVEIIECISYFNSDSRDFQDKEIFNDLGYQTVSPSGYYTTKHHPCIWTSVYKKKLIETIPFREKVFYEDSDWKIKAYTSANRIGLLDYRFYVYYENVQSTVRKKSLNLFFDALEANILCRQAYRNSLLDDDVKQKKLLVSSTSVVRSIIAVRDYSVSDGIKILKAYRNSYYYHDIRKDIPIYSGIFFDILLRIPILLTLTVKAAIGFKRIFTNWVTDSNDSCPY